MKTEIFKNYADFLNREDKELNGVSESFAKQNPDYNLEKNNKACWNCSSCRSCSDCSSCSSCSDCSEKKNTKEDLKIPVIKKVHTKILQAVSLPDALEMGSWHTCDTTHCRAGWIVILAGKAGKELEEKTSTLFAAMCIVNKSSDIPIPLQEYFKDNHNAMTDIRQCADFEAMIS